MRVTCIGTGSSGNCFLLEDSGETLILDAGVKFNKLLACKRLRSFSRVTAALVTHKHKDHCLCAPDLVKAGIDVYTPSNFVTRKRFRVGGYGVLPFLCQHDVENYGYIIRCPSDATVVYATDTARLPKIAHVDVWIVECNYTDSLLRHNLEQAETGFSYYGRVEECHMGQEALREYFETLKSPTAAIILCHLSEHGNADPQEMLRTFAPYADVVDVACGGKEWEL